jgi:integrase
MSETAPRFSVPAKPRGDGTFIASVERADGTWRSVQVPKAIGVSHRAAAHWVAEHVEALAAGASPRELGKRPAGSRGRTFAELGPEILAARAKDSETKRLARATREQFVSNWDRCIEPFFGKMAPHEVETRHVLEFRDDLAGRLEPRTVRNVFMTLGLVFKVVLGRGLDPKLGRHPVRHAMESGLLTLPRPEDGPIVYLTPHEAAKLLACADVHEHRRVRYVLAFLSGMRDGEIAALTWADVDLAKRVVHVTKALPLMRKKGERPEVSKTKTFASQRLLPLHPLAADFLERFKAKAWAERVGWTPRPTDYVFPDEQGRAARPDSAGMLRTDLRGARLPDKKHDAWIDFHATRRSFATWLEDLGVYPETVDRLLGHVAKSVRAKHYAAVQIAPLREAVERLTLPGFGGRSSEPPSETGSSGPNGGNAPRGTSRKRAEKTRRSAPEPDEAQSSAISTHDFLNRRSCVQVAPGAPEKNRQKGDPDPRVEEGDPRMEPRKSETEADEAPTSAPPSTSSTASSPPAPNPRAALASTLAASVTELAGTGDLDGARLAHEALGRLLGLAAPSPAPGVVDLGEERAKRRT